MLVDKNILVKSMAARSMGLTMNERALDDLEQFIDEDQGPDYPEKPYNDEDVVLVAVVGFNVIKSIIRIAGQSYQPGNPGDLMEIWNEYIEIAADYYAAHGTAGQGGAP